MRRDIGKLLAGLIAVAVLAFVFLRDDQLEHLAQTVREGSPILLAVAVAAELVRYLTQAVAFRWCFRAVDAEMPFAQDVKLVFQTFFVDTVIPSMNMSGTSVVIAEAARHGIADGKATGAALLRQISISIGFLIVMVGGFAGLAIAGRLEAGWLVMGVCAIALVAGLSAALALAAAKPAWVLRALKPIERPVDRVLARFGRKSIDAWVSNMVSTYAESAKLMVGNKAAIARDIGWSTTGSLFEMLCFAFVCAAFGVHDIQAMVCGYVVATLFAMFSPVPQGVGVVEGAALVAFTLFGVEQATGMAAIMVYRAIVFWLPFLAGAIVMQRSTVKRA